MLSPGFTLVVSPLISLMQDQIWALQQLNGVAAAMLDSSSTKEHVAVCFLLKKNSNDMSRVECFLIIPRTASEEPDGGQDGIAESPLRHPRESFLVR